MSATAVSCLVRLVNIQPATSVEGERGFMPCFALPCRLRQGVCPARAPGSGGAPPWVGGLARELPLHIATQHIGYTPFGGTTPRPSPLNVGFALGTMYRVRSYRGARVLRLSAVYVHCFRSHFGSRLETLPGAHAPRVCWLDLRVDCVPGGGPLQLVATCVQNQWETASCVSAQLAHYPRLRAAQVLQPVSNQVESR